MWLMKTHWRHIQTTSVTECCTKCVSTWIDTNSYKQILKKINKISLLMASPYAFYDPDMWLDPAWFFQSKQMTEAKLTWWLIIHGVCLKCRIFYNRVVWNINEIIFQRGYWDWIYSASNICYIDKACHQHVLNLQCS